MGPGSFFSSRPCRHFVRHGFVCWEFPFGGISLDSNFPKYASSHFRDLFFKNHNIWFEMGIYGSVWARIKTGRSPMAKDHFWTPPDPQMAHTNPEMANLLSTRPTSLEYSFIKWSIFPLAVHMIAIFWGVEEMGNFLEASNGPQHLQQTNSQSTIHSSSPPRLDHSKGWLLDHGGK